MKILGSTYKFICPGCGYTVKVGGGKQIGKMIVTLTIACETCKQLSDFVLSKPPKVLDPSWKPPKKNCPKCKSDQTNFWQNPGECPKCGKMMEKSDELFPHWD